MLPKSKHNVAVSCTAQCYGPGVATLASHTEAMAAGNVIFGGIIGLGVDAASGAMNTYDPGVEVIMTPVPGCGRVPGKAKGVPMANAGGSSRLTGRAAPFALYRLLPSKGIGLSVAGSTSSRQRTLTAIMADPSRPIPRANEPTPQWLQNR